MSEDPFLKLTGRIGQSLETLKRRLDYLESKLDEFRELRSQVVSKPLQMANGSGNIMLYLGDNWFVEKTPDQTIKFCDRRIAAFNETKVALTENLKSTEKALSDLSRLGLFDEQPLEQKTVEDKPGNASSAQEEEPIFEIREELDDEGRVTSSSVKPQAASLNDLDPSVMEKLLHAMRDKAPRDEVELKLEKGSKFQPKKSPETVKFEQSERIVDVTDETVSDPLTSDSSSAKPKSILKSPKDSAMSDRDTDNESDGSRRKSVTFAPELDVVELEPTQPEIISRPVGPTNSISPEDLITFELMAQELVDDEDDYDMEDDYDFEEEEDEDDHGCTRGSLFPGMSSSVFESMKASRANKESSLETEKPESHKEVTEDNTPRPRKVSRFKATRMAEQSGASDKTKNLPNNSSKSKSNAPIENIMERTPPSVQEGVVGDIKDNFNSRSNDVGSPTIVNKAINENVPTNNHTAENFGARNTVGSQKSKHKSVPLNIGRSNTITTPEIEEIKSNKKKAGAWDDWVPEGFDKEVFAKAMDYYVQSGMTEEEFLEAHDDEEMESSDKPMPIIASEPSSSGPLSAQIIEKEVNAEEDENMDDPDSVNMGEIAEEYQRMRQKFINRTGGFKKTEEELAVEPIHEEGKRVSRFKAARMRMPSGN